MKKEEAKNEETDIGNLRGAKLFEQVRLFLLAPM